MVTRDPTTFQELAEIEELAFLLFSECYGMDLPCAFAAARRMLPTLKTFAAEWDADAVGAAPLYTAPLNGREPQMAAVLACAACGDPTANADYCQACRELGEASQTLADNERIALQEMAEVAA